MLELNIGRRWKEGASNRPDICSELRNGILIACSTFESWKGGPVWLDPEWFLDNR